MTSDNNRHRLKNGYTSRSAVATYVRRIFDVFSTCFRRVFDARQRILTHFSTHTSIRRDVCVNVHRRILTYYDESTL